MKSTKTTVYTFVMYMICSSCINAIDYDGAKKETVKNNLQFQTEVISDIISPKIEKPFQLFQINGNTKINTSILSKSSFWFRLEGKIINIQQSGEFEISDGGFYLCVNGSGCYLIGHYNGHGIEDDYGIRISSLIYIDQGVGQLNANEGQLQLTLIGERLSNVDQEMKYNIEVNGYLSNYIDN